MWKKSNKFIITPVILAIGWMAIFNLYPLETHKIIQRRANYFIIKTPVTGKILLGSQGNLYLPNQHTPVGTFKVTDVKDDECLCMIESISPGIEDSRISRVSFTSMPTHKEAKKTSLPPLIIAGIHFVPLDRNGDNNGDKNEKFYLSQSPFPLKSITPLSIAGIKNLLYKIETENQRFSADFIKFSRIRTLGLDKIIDFTDKKKIFLGTVEGRLSMIFKEEGALQFTHISSHTLEKYSNDIFFHIMLEKKEK